MGKGDRRRQKQISASEEDLRWELALKCSNNPERKEEILKQLEKIAETKNDDKGGN